MGGDERVQPLEALRQPGPVEQVPGFHQGSDVDGHDTVTGGGERRNGVVVAGPHGVVTEEVQLARRGEPDPPSPARARRNGVR